MKGRRSTVSSKLRAVRPIDSLESRVLLAYSSLVQDVNQTTEMLSPEQITVVGGVAYFSGRGIDGSGGELWKTDGTTAGTVLVKDIYPGLTGSGLTGFTNVGGTLYFTARDPVAGNELWKSDGTTAGTVLVKDVRPGPADSSPKNLAAVGNTLYFSADDGVGGAELWKSDGTDAGTVRVKDIYAGATGSDPQYLVAYNGALLFAAADSAGGREVWRSDGTAAGTTRVADIAGSSSSSTPKFLTSFAGAVYFSAYAGGTGGRADLYRTDGTATGTTRVADIVNSTSGGGFGTIVNITPSGDRLYFTAGNPNTARFDLWGSDGTTAGTSLLLGGGPFRSTDRLTAAGQRSVIFTNTTTAAGAEPWTSDGTVAGTKMLKDVIPGTANGVGDVLYARVGNTVYFAPNRVTDGLTELWKSDLTTAGTVLVTNVATSAGYLSWPTAFGSKLLFTGLRYVGTGDLYISDGSAAGTLRIGATAEGNSSGMQDYPTFSAAFVRSGETMYFAASDGVHGREVWRTRAGATPGTLSGAEMVADLAPGGFPSDPDNFAAGPDGSVYFKANTPATGTELYRVPPGGGAPQLIDINPGAASSTPQVVGTLGSWVYLWASDATTASAMWRYNPSTGAMAKMTSSINSLITRPSPLVVMAGYAYFAAATSNTGTELWRTDGSSTVAQLVKDINPSGDSFPSLLTATGNTLYFVARDAVAGNELWKSDGTTAGTVVAADLTPGAEWTTFNQYLFGLNGVAYFDAQPGTTGAPEHLWRSDGTPAGTYELAPLTNAQQFTSLNGQLYFAADDAKGRAVFRYDPGSPGVAPVRLTPTTTGTFVLRPTALLAAGTHVYFVALAGAGRGDHAELWQTDGTPGGTAEIHDVGPIVPAGTTPSLGVYFTLGFYALGANSTRLFFPAWTPELGQEVYSLPLTDPAGAVRGTVFDDRDRDGVRDAGEPGLAERTVFVDLDKDGAPDPDEPTATTDASGNYALAALDAGAYAVRQIVPAGWQATGAPAPRSVTVAAAPVDGVNFGATDVVAPEIVSGAPAADRPAFALRVLFSEDVGASLAAGDVHLENLTSGATIDPAKVAVSFDPALFTATFAFPGYPGGALPDGNYRATVLAAGVADATGNAARANLAFDFYVLAGDANRDRIVNFDDLLILAKNYNGSGRTYLEGDFTNDGVVNFDDLLILAKGYNGTLAALPAPAPMFVPAAAPLAAAKKDKPLFSTTPVAKPAAPAKPKPAAKPTKR
jgi:ELWxxDGT repeat protein